LPIDYPPHSVRSGFWWEIRPSRSVGPAALAPDRALFRRPPLVPIAPAASGADFHERRSEPPHGRRTPLGRLRTQRKSSTVYFVCASCRSRSRIRSITSGSLSSIEASSVRASRVAFKSSSSFAWTARVSRRSARWMNSVIVQTINVAMACQSNVVGSKTNQNNP
jgi:hypothetical protein